MGNLSTFYLPHFPEAHFPLAAHFLAIFLAAHFPLVAHFPEAEHFILALASLLVVHPVNVIIDKPTKVVNINFFIITPNLF